MAVLPVRVEAVAVALILGVVHRDVGAPHQRLRVLAVGRVPRDADAAVHLQRDVVEHDRLAHAREHVLDDRRQRRHVVGPHRRQDRELVAAEARDHPAFADPLGQSRPEMGEQIVAVLVAERVVDVLEVVEVEQHHCERRGSALGLPRSRRRRSRRTACGWRVP